MSLWPCIQKWREYNLKVHSDTNQTIQFLVTCIHILLIKYSTWSNFDPKYAKQQKNTSKTSAALPLFSCSNLNPPPLLSCSNQNPAPLLSSSISKLPPLLSYSNPKPVSILSCSNPKPASLLSHSNPKPAPLLSSSIQKPPPASEGVVEK